MIVDAIKKLVERTDLSRDEAVSVMEEIMSGKTTDAQIAAFITALRMKGETIDEIYGFAKVMREH
ncbi:MAG: anthranilate phosphoribosyltransferase, partial [Actinobacteria bacterium]|nr:anthranilate phosphoribosyltransferase [Actinomycetota bacterium]